MRDMIMLIAVLTLACLISALALALVNNITKDRIVEQKQLAKLRAVSAALPQSEVKYDNEPVKDVVKIPEWKESDGSPKEIYIGKRNGKVVGAAFTSAGEGYGGFITIMMGIDMTGMITGIEIIEHLETPGLGSNIESPELFKNQFRGKKSSQNGELAVIKGRKAKESWEIDALTGATISPRGVVQAINDGLAKFKQYKERMIR